MASTNPEIRNRRQNRRHPYPAQQRFPPPEAEENNPGPAAPPQQNQVDGVVEARIGHREFIFIALLLLLRLFVAFILHANTIRALTENSDSS
ncbi:hypothetical protein PM082_013861 [Marasmius tenuissimus]|nr:hypothetical protein PM082_013861 [Marasmius tenuissimus]